MSKYLPFAGTNAIQEAIMGVHFEKKFTPNEILNIQEIIQQSDLNQVKQLPKYLYSMQLNSDNSKQGIILSSTHEQYLSGIRVKLSDSNGTSDKGILVDNQNISIHFMKYRGWEKTLNEIQDFIATISQIQKNNRNFIQAFSLRYVDSFSFDGPPELATVDKLFNNPCDYIPNRCFLAGSLWHNFTGWIDKHDDNSIIFNQLNINSIEKDSVVNVTIDHNMICQLKQTIKSMGKLKQFTKQTSSRQEGILNHLHSINLQVLQQLLIEELAIKIGLK